MTDEKDFWGSGLLREPWWRENGAACRASEQQIRFACARHNGANKSRAASLAGYKGDADALRSAGVRAEGTKAVDDLLTLASAAEVGVTDSAVTFKEVKRKIGKLVRSPDGAIALKASELFFKLEAAEKERGEHPDDDGLSESRLARDILVQENGASTFMLYYRAQNKGMGHPANYPLLHDVYAIAKQEPFGQQIFVWCGRDLSETMRQALEEHLADPNWQLETRQKIWAEIGIAIGANGQAKMMDVSHAA